MTDERPIQSLDLSKAGADNPRVGGLWVALVTPFLDGECDTESLKRLCSHLLDAEVDGFLVCGTTGEGSLLSLDERALVVSTAVEVVGDRVIAGAFGPSASDIVAGADVLRAAGAAAIAVLPPPYVTLSQDEISAHFTVIADRSSIPIVLYNFPGQTPTPISTDVVLALSGHRNVIATKQSRPVLDQDFVCLISGAAPDFSVVVGNPLLLLAAASLGANGAMLAAANVEPQLLVELWRMVANEEWQAAREHFRRALPRLLTLHGSGPHLKRTLYQRGLIASPELRLPLGSAASPLSPSRHAGSVAVVS